MKKILFIAIFLLSFQFYAQDFKVNQNVFIHYQEAWFPGKILKVQADGYLVSYDDYDESWNEVVPKNRLSLTGKEAFKSEETTSDVEMALEHLSAEEEPFETASTNNSSSSSRLDEICNCWSKANKSGFLTDKEACLDLQDKHKSEMEAGSQEYMEYKEKAFDCKSGVTNTLPAGSKDMQSMINEVCNCFTEAKKGNRVKVDCYKLQGNLGGTIEDDDKSTYFLQETMKCDQ